MSFGVPALPTLASTIEVIANLDKIPARLIDALSARTVYASSIAGVVLDCDLFTGLTALGGTPTDNHAAINTLLATATATNPVHLILDGGCAIGHALLIPATGHVTISGHGWSTGLYILPGSNSNPITNTAGTDLASAQSWSPGLGATANRGQNVTLSNFRIHCNRGTYPTGNCNGVADGTNGAAVLPDARGSQTTTWLLTGPMFVGLDNLTIEDLWIYDAPTFHIDLYACTKVRIRGCRIEAAVPTFTGNTDGIHINGGSSEVSIRDCWFATGDDAIAINLDEGNGQPGSDFLIDNIFLHGCLNAGRIYGLTNGISHRVSITNVRGTVQNAGWNIGYEGGGAAAVDSNHSIYIGNNEFAFTNTDARNALVWINTSAGNIEIDDCGFVDPTIACPIVKLDDNAQVVSSLRINRPRIHRSPDGNAAAWILDGTVGTIGNLEILNASVTETYGDSYTDIANLINLNGTRFGSLTFSGKLKGVGTAVNVTSLSASGPIDIPDLTHQANTGTNTAHSVVAAGSTIPVSIGRYRGVNLAGIASGTVSLTGPGLPSSGFGIADSLIGPGTIYRSSTHSALAYMDGASVVNLFTTTLPPATAYTLTGPSSGTVSVVSGAFTVTPNGVYTGTITITLSGGGLSGTIVLTFSSSSTPQTFTIDPPSAGTVTLTPTNSTTLTDPAALSYVAGFTTYLSDGFSGTAGTSLTGRVPDTTQNGTDVWGPALSEGILALATGGATSSGTGPNWSADYPLTGVSGGVGVYTIPFTFANTGGDATFYLRADAAEGSLSDVIAIDASQSASHVNLLVISGGTTLTNTNYTFSFALATLLTAVVTITSTTVSMTINGTAIFTGITIPTFTGSRMYIRQQGGSAGSTLFQSVLVHA